MTDKGGYITVEAGETDLSKLLDAVRQQQRPIRILSHGQAVAELSPVLHKRFGPPDPSLRARILTSDHEITSEDDWSETTR
jgi:antitoxin (DNA-binding transcriptional repressor) of toxin-antitoxin stability system